MLEQLTESGSYKKLTKDPSKKIIKEVMQAILNTSLDDNIENKLIPKEPIIRWIYGLPKIHKEGVPLKKIVKMIGSPTFKLARWLES